MHYMTFLVLALIWAVPAFADDVQWQEALRKIEDHPEVAAYIREAEAAREYAAGEKGLPDPMIFIENRNISGMNEEKMIGFSQPLPAPGARQAAARGYAADSERSKLLAAFARKTLEAKLITVLAGLQKVTALEKIAHEQKKLLKLAEKSAQGRLSANLGEVVDVTMLGADAADVNMTLADLEEERHDLQNMLAYITGSEDTITAPETVPLTWAGDTGKTWPVMIAAAEKEKTETEVNLQEAAFRPAFEIGGSINRMDDGENSGTLRLALSVPLWSASSQAPKLRGAQAQLAARDSDVQRVRREMLEKLAHLQKQIETSSHRKTLIREKMAALKKTAAARKRAYEAGKSALPEVVKSRLAALDAEAALARETARRIELVAGFNSYIAGDGNE